MATAYGGWVATDDFQARLDYSTSTSGTTVTITAKLYINSKAGWSNYGSGSLSIKKGSTTLGSASGSNKAFSSGQTVLVCSKSVSVTKTTSAQTITISGSVGASYTSSKSTASATITVAALSTYTISYANGGHGTAPSSQTKTQGTALTLRSAITATGYTFQNWKSSSDNKTYAGGASYSADAATTMTAQWTAKKYTITYNANGHGTAPASQTKTYGSTLKLQGAITATGYTFQNWNTKADGSGTSYAAGATMSATAISANITLYAIWTAVTYTIAYANGGHGTAPSNQTKTYGVTLALRPAISVTGYTFLGWKSSSDNVTYNGGANYTVNAASTMTAQWRANAPTLTVSKVYRSDSSGLTNDEGTYVTVTGSWSQTESKGVTVTITVNEQNASDASGNGTSGSFQITVAANVDVNTSYPVTISATNGDGTTTVTKNLGSSAYPLDVDENGNFAIGKVAGNTYKLDVAGAAHFDTPLEIASGGTGLSSSPSMLTNLGSTTAANILAASPRPGITGTLGTANGGTGNTSGTVAKLTTARSLYVNLASAYNSSSPVTFDGSANKALPVTGALPIANGGTGKTSAADARGALGAAARSWTSLGSVTGTTSLTINLSSYYEVCVVARYSTTYLGSVIFPKTALHASTLREIYLGGWGNNSTTSNRRAIADMSQVKLTPIAVTTDQTDRTSSATWIVYAR